MASRFATFLIIAAAAAPAAAGDSYTVAATIRHAEGTVGAPVLRVDPEAVARVRVDGADGYGLMVDIAPLEGGQGVTVNVEVETSRGEIASRLSTPLGHPVSVASGDIGLELTVTRDGGGDGRVADATR